MRNILSSTIIKYMNNSRNNTYKDDSSLCSVERVYACFEVPAKKCVAIFFCFGGRGVRMDLRTSSGASYQITFFFKSKAHIDETKKLNI